MKTRANRVLISPPPHRPLTTALTYQQAYLWKDREAKKLQEAEEKDGKKKK
jgi:hypothetical protein